MICDFKQCYVTSSFSYSACVRDKSLQSCPTCATLWTVALQAPHSMGFSRREYWGGSPCLPPGDLPHPGIEPTPLMSPAVAGVFFTTRATWEALLIFQVVIYVYYLVMKLTHKFTFCLWNLLNPFTSFGSILIRHPECCPRCQPIL